MFTPQFPESYPELEVSAAIQRIQDRERLQQAIAARRASHRQILRRVLNWVA